MGKGGAVEVNKPVNTEEIKQKKDLLPFDKSMYKIELVKSDKGIQFSALWAFLLYI